MNEKERKKLENKLYQLLLELLDTERTYVADLEKVWADYSPLLTSLESNEPQGKFPGGGRKRRSKSQVNSQISNYFLLRKVSELKTSKSVVVEQNIDGPSLSDVRTVLGNLEDLKDYHRHTLLPKLEDAVQDSQLISILFKTEENRMVRKYGRYCINNSRASEIVEEHLKFFTSYQQQRGLTFRIDAMLIKPIQRMTRYLLFLTSLASTCSELGYQSACEDLSTAREVMRSTVEHTNTLSWVGTMHCCPLDLSSLGLLLKSGLVTSVPPANAGKKTNRRSGVKMSQLFLFQQTLILCWSLENTNDKNRPNLYYHTHISVNQLRVRDVIEEDEASFEVHKLEPEDMKMLVMGEVRVRRMSAIVVRIQCESPSVKQDWVTTINQEVKKLRLMAQMLAM